MLKLIQIKTFLKMEKKELIDNIAENLFGKVENVNSLEKIRNYFNQLDLEKLKYMLKKTDKNNCLDIYYF